MKKLLLTFLLALFFGFLSQGQEKQSLPKGLTKAEEYRLSTYSFIKSTTTAPPTNPVRTAAEWEEVEYLVLTWDTQFQIILKELVEVGISECKVLIITNNPSSVQTYLTGQGVDLTKVEFINRSWDSIWMRDYAGNTVYDNDVGDRYLVDWIYNRPRPNDNQAPSAHASQLSIPLYVTDTGSDDLVNTGGNFMSDGMGNGFASKLILEENQAGNPYNVSTKTEAQVDQIMDNFMGIKNYIKMDALPYDRIHHIDMHMKLLDEETILVSKYPDGVADGPQINTNINYVTSTFNSHFGTNYEIKWVDAPPSTDGNHPDNNAYYRTYTNAVFINKSIVVPTYRAEYDDPALALYRELLPGYNVVPIDIDDSGRNLISRGGGIHCITHTIGVADPLLIVHQHHKEVASHLNIPFTALIKHRSGIANAKVFWRVKGTTPWSENTLSASTGDNWTATFSVPATASEIEYYIWAEATSGKTMTRPIVAPAGFWTFKINPGLSVADQDLNIIPTPYPNPATDKVHLNLTNLKGPVDLAIYNVLGQRLQQQKIAAGTTLYQLPLKPNWQGTLILEFNGDFGKVHQKIYKL